MDKLKKVFSSGALETLCVKHGHQFVQLKEKGCNTKLKKVEIYGIPADSLVIKLDGAKPLNDLLASEGGIRQRCDYVIVCKNANLPLFLFVELKSYSIKRKEIINQFKGGTCLVKYFCSLSELFLEHKFLMDWNSAACYYVLFFKQKLGKSVSTKRSGAKCNTPETFRLLPNPQGLRFNDLIEIPSNSRN